MVGILSKAVSYWLGFCVKQSRIGWGFVWSSLVLIGILCEAVSYWLGFCVKQSVCFRLRSKQRHCLFVGCLTSQHHASVSQGQICSDNFMCCHTEIEFADQTFYLTQSQYTDTGPTSPSPDPKTPGAWQGSHWSANIWVTGVTRPGNIPAQEGFESRIFGSRGWHLNH